MIDCSNGGTTVKFAEVHANQMREVVVSRTPAVLCVLRRAHAAVRRAIAVFVVAFVVVSISLVTRVWAAPFDTSGTDWEGCSRLVDIAREELGTSRVNVVDEIDYERLGPSDGLLLIHG